MNLDSTLAVTKTCPKDGVPLSQAVNEVKRAARFTVIIGNPPYSGRSANKGAWIRELLRGSTGKRRVENYFEVDGGPLNERNPK